MSKTFTCCKLVERVKEFLGKSQSSDEDKYQFLEFLCRSTLKITNKRVKEWEIFNGKSEPVWTADYDYLFCDECKEWFKQQEELQFKLIDAEIEKEIAEGTFYSNPTTQKALEGVSEQVNRWSKNIEQKIGQKKSENNPLPFGKSPQE